MLVDLWREPDLRFPGLDGARAELVLDALFRLVPERTFRRIPGRETFPWPGRSEWIVKRVHGGEVRDYWHDRLHGRARSPAQREAQNLLELRRLGVKAPRPLLWVEEDDARKRPSLRGQRRGRSALVLETVLHSESLRQRLARSAPHEIRRWLRELLDLVATLHESGWVHRDLYLEHVVLGPDSLVLLDCARARRLGLVRRRWLVKDLAALWHSAPASVPRTERLRFLAAWLARVEPGSARNARAARRRWARAILAKARRLGAHRPRFADPESAEGGLVTAGERAR